MGVYRINIYICYFYDVANLSEFVNKNNLNALILSGEEFDNEWRKILFPSIVQYIYQLTDLPTSLDHGVIMNCSWDHGVIIILSIIMYNTRDTYSFKYSCLSRSVAKHSQSAFIAAALVCVCRSAVQMVVYCSQRYLCESECNECDWNLNSACLLLFPSY